MIPARQPHPDDLFMITREELDRCCSQMSAAGYKVSANYVEALVLSRPHTSPPAPEPDHKAPICENCGLDSTTCRMDMAGCLQAQNAAAKAERERVLDEVREALSHIRYQEEDMWFIEAAIKKIESLRAQQQGGVSDETHTYCI